MLHLFYKTSRFQKIEEILNAFKEVTQVDISDLKTLQKSDVYFVEIDKVEKSILLHIKQLLFDKSGSLIYFFINDSHSLMLFQLASFLNVKTIITQKNSTSKVIANIKKDISVNKLVQVEHLISDTLSNDYAFMIFDSLGVKFASKKIYYDFKCKDLEDVKSKICSHFNVEEFLKKSMVSEESFKFLSNDNRYKIKSSASSVNDDIFIYLEPLLKSETHNTIDVDFIKNRIYFIEVLKEKILEKSISESLLGVITLQVQNINKLRDEWSEYEIEEAIHNLLLEVDGAMDSPTLLAQYDNSLYLALFEGLDFEAIKSKALSIQNHILAYTQNQKIKLIVGLYAFDVNDLELNKALEIIFDLSQDKVSHQDTQTQKLYKLINVNEEMDDTQVIDILLQAIFTNKSPIKLINIYKGLCINTSSDILKKTSKEIDVTFQQLQGTVMNFEKSTVIQSASFSKDIIADVLYIDNKKRFARLNNFRFAQGSANSRKYSRVTCSQRTPITVIHDKGTINGTILDISMNSIAIQTRLYKNIDSFELDVVNLNFTLPIDNHSDGYVQLSLEAAVKFVLCDENFCKIVVDLYENQASEAILMEYVYNRQKEIIVELKKQASFLT